LKIDIFTQRLEQSIQRQPGRFRFLVAEHRLSSLDDYNISRIVVRMEEQTMICHFSEPLHSAIKGSGIQVWNAEPGIYRFMNHLNLHFDDVEILTRGSWQSPP
jgi:hypothetical protein